jgi:hypothetical protein
VPHPFTVFVKGAGFDFSGFRLLSLFSFVTWQGGRGSEIDDREDAVPNRALLRERMGVSEGKTQRSL